MFNHVTKQNFDHNAFTDFFNDFKSKRAEFEKVVEDICFALKDKSSELTRYFENTYNNGTVNQKDLINALDRFNYHIYGDRLTFLLQFLDTGSYDSYDHRELTNEISAK
jgi:hypothetical protein